MQQIEHRLGVSISNRGNEFRLHGPTAAIHAAEQVINNLYTLTSHQLEALTPGHIHLSLQEIWGAGEDELTTKTADHDKAISIRTKRGTIRPRGANQQHYVHDIRTHDISFGIGPAGTGKTYLAVACAVDALERNEVRRILLVRPAVEAGERLGFLPGDMAEKIDPYLRPLYDALYEMLGFERVGKLLEKSVIEVAPLAFMRGRTLNEAFIIMDEAQNTTVEQMKMFLTRLGFGSKAVITGDVTQVDLPRHQNSGLKHVMDILNTVKGVSFTHFVGRDVVRHPLVQRIVAAYDKHENGN